MSDAYVFCSSGTSTIHIYYTNTFTCCYPAINHIFMKLLFTVCYIFLVLVLGVIFFCLPSTCPKNGFGSQDINRSGEREEKKTRHLFERASNTVYQKPFSLQLCSHIHKQNIVMVAKASEKKPVLKRNTIFLFPPGEDNTIGPT